MTSKDFEGWLKSFDTVLTDCDETLWYENQPFPAAVETIGMFRDLGKSVFFLTNSSKSRKTLESKLKDMGFKVSNSEIIGSSYAVAAHLEDQKFDKEKLIYIIGNEELEGELSSAGYKCIGRNEDEDK